MPAGFGSNIDMDAMSDEELIAYVASMDPGEAERQFQQARELSIKASRESYSAWCEEVGRDRGWAPAKHHRVIMQAVEETITGKGPNRLLITAPPGSAKSTYTSELLPGHLLSRTPAFNLIGTSNTSTLAEDFSERTLALIDTRPDLVPFRIRKRSAALWTTTMRGRYRAAGVGVGIQGNRADGVLIDDAVKSREQADSETMREKLWNWFIVDLRTRLKPKAWVIHITTRWHEDDLAGRLLERQKGLWRVLNIPAQATGDEPDPLGRKPGEWLWEDDDYGYGGALKLIKAEYEAAGAMRDWEALFQGKPTAGDGTIFKVHKLEVLETAPAKTVNIVRAWDLAATKKMGTADPDWTVGVKMMRTPEDRYVVLDVVRLRGGPDEVEAAIVNTAKQDGRGVKVGLPQDPGGAGKFVVENLTKKLAGFRVESSPETGDKATRAGPAAAQCNVGNMGMVQASWNAPLRSELAAFPSGTHDDQVDALSRAFSMIALHRPLVVSNEALRDLKYGLRQLRKPLR